ncbi:MAG: DUF4340 domain-containing protein, partial [Chromatiales bacterium]|nr:DUF4340 domain-containing protein [Chromatiales bacterium]
MTRPFVALSVLTLAMVAACVVVIGEQQATETAVSGTGELFFPGFGAEVISVAAVEVHRADGQFTLARTPHGWVNLGLGGYPALGGRVDTTLAALAALSRVAPKTSRARWHQKLSVEDVAAGARSTRLVVKHGDGTTMADIIVGGGQRPGAGRRRAGVYVRPPDAEAAWLADGSFDIHYDVADWSERALIDIKPTAVQSMTIVHRDGERIALGRVSSSTDELTLA